MWPINAQKLVENMKIRLFLTFTPKISRPYQVFLPTQFKNGFSDLDIRLSCFKHRSGQSLI